MEKKKRATPKGPFLCYALTDASERRSYTGQTNDFARRLRQHNGELAGGARYTSRGGGGGKTRWHPLFKVHGFATHRSVLRFEWTMKKRRCRRARSGPAGRVRQLEHILSFGALYTNAHDNWVECHMTKDRYLRWSGLSSNEFDERRRAQRIAFKFVER